MNRRNAERITMEAPLKMGNGIATTRDISNGGIYFVSSEEFRLGGDIRFSLELEHVLPDKPLRLNCQGQVVRIEEIGCQIGVAAKINQYRCCFESANITHLKNQVSENILQTQVGRR